MRNRILGIAGLMIRQAVRSRFVVCLFLLMLLILSGFALTIEGDGTAAGRLQVLLSYAMNAVGVLLSIATLWLACGSLSIEIENRRIHLLVVKPVRSFELWLGKWLGVLGVALLLLVAAGLFLGGAAWIAQTRTQPEGTDGKTVRERILVARERVYGVRLLNSAEGMARWRLDCPEFSEGDARVATLRYRFMTELRDLPPVRGRWVLRGQDGDVWFQADRVAHLDGVNRLEIPLDRLHSRERASLSFQLFPDDEGKSRHVMFHPEHEVELLVPVGGFTGNLVRALLLVFCHLALLAALGVTMGSLFTFPVAVFVAAAFLVATLSAQFFAFSSAPERAADHHHDGDESPSLVERIGAHGARGMQIVMSPALRYRVDGRLATGIRVPWIQVQDAVAVLAFGYGGILCLLGCMILRRRELALPV